MAANKESIWDVLPRLQNAIGEEGILFAQTMSREAQAWWKAKRLSNAVPGLVVKIPVTSKVWPRLKMLKRGYHHAGNRRLQCFSGLLAALAGAKYIAPYVNRIDAQGGDGIRHSTRTANVTGLHAPNSMVLAASFKTRVRRWIAYWRDVKLSPCH